MSSPLTKPIGILILAWILITLGSLDILGAVWMAVRGEPRSALVALIFGSITLVLGFALRAFRRWSLLVMLAYLGCVVVFGVLSGLGGFSAGWLGVLFATPFLLYLWKVRDAFESSEDGRILSSFATLKLRRSRVCE